MWPTESDSLHMIIRSLSHQPIEDVANFLRTLLWVALLTAFVIDISDAKACLVTLRPFEVAARRLSAKFFLLVTRHVGGGKAYSIRLHAM
jgi:hypothetical protein